MKLGCIGCLTLVLLTATFGATLWGAVQTLRAPEFPSAETSPVEGVRAQQKIFEIARRGARRGDKAGEPIVLSEGELNAFLSRHLPESAELPLTEMALRLGDDGVAEFRARLPLRHLMGESPLAAFGGILPAGWLDHRVWLRVGVRPRLEPEPARRERRYLRLEVTEFAVGRQRLPAVLLRVLLDPAALGVLRWRMPDGIDAVTVEPGRVVVRTASSRSRSEAGDRKATPPGPGSPPASDGPRSSREGGPRDRSRPRRSRDRDGAGP